MIMGQSCTGVEFRDNDPLWSVNPLILRQSAIFGDIVDGRILGRWVEQGGGSTWTDINVPDIEVARFSE